MSHDKIRVPDLLHTPHGKENVTKSLGEYSPFPKREEIKAVREKKTAIEATAWSTLS